jgi:hypothetical protein
MRANVHPRCWAAVVTVVIAILVRPAAAQGVAVRAEGTVNVGYNQTTRSTAVLDPQADPADIPDSSTASLFTEIRPGISLDAGSPRLSWRAGYLFAGTLNFDGGAPSYSHQATGALIADLTPRTVLTVSSAFAQGGTSFLLSQRPADAGKPEIRAPGNPNLLSATLSELVAWQAGRHLQVQQNLIGAMTAPQDDPGRGNTSLIGTLSLERLYERDAVGAELRAGISRLDPLRADLEPYESYTSAILGRWNHDFTVGWNGLLTAGIEQLFTDTGNRPLAFLPTGSAAVRYSANGVGGALEFIHGTATNLQVGTVSLADQLTARGVITIDELTSRVLSFSAGFLHNEQLGEVVAQVAAGTGNAVQGDAAFTTAITRNVLGSVRYSLAYQYGQDTGLGQDGDSGQSAGLGPTLAHIVFIGVTASYGKQHKRPFPTRGQRVDGSDSQGFPVVPNDDTFDDDTAGDRQQSP